MSERDHEHWREQVSAYLLGALDDERAAALEEHLAGCEECRAELAWLGPAAQVLPESVERVEPPPGLRTRIMAEVRADADVAPEGTLRRTRPFRSMRLGFAAGLAILALVAGAVVGSVIRDGDSSGEAVTAVAGKPPGPTAELVSEGGSGTLRLANVEGLRPDEVLQAWVRRGGRVESADVLFVPNSAGAAAAVLDDLDGVDAVMVTAEPRGGSEFPTSEPMVSVPVPQ